MRRAGEGNSQAPVLMVQCWELRGEQQDELYRSFMKAAVEKYGRAR